MDYELLRLSWWVLLGVVLIGFAIMDGFDLGVAVLLPFIAKNDVERRMMVNSIGPFWEGNQVWLILGGGTIFAAWPYVYAVSFSGFYLAFFLILVGLILRPVAIKYRSKKETYGWRDNWDKIHFVSALLPALLCGIAIGNMILGVPFTLDKSTLQPIYTGHFFALLTPFPILIGLLSLSMLVRHGAIFTALKVDEPVASRAVRVSSVASKIMIMLFIAASIWVYYLNGYVITSDIDRNAYSNPLHKTVIVQQGAWFTNYLKHPWQFLAPILAIVCSSVSVWYARRRSFMTGLVYSSISIFGVVTTAGLGVFPFILPSSTNPNASLTVWDASSSYFTLKMMLVLTLIFLPIVILYTIWAYSKLRGKLMAHMFTNIKNTKGKSNEHL